MSLIIKREVATYYTNKVNEFGATPKGVDWNSENSQILRFQQLAKVLPNDPALSFSLLDFGCGYGGLLDFLKKEYKRVQYIGYDISNEMILRAKEKFQNVNAQWVTNEAELQPMDYIIASGIFNVKLEFSDLEWQSYIFDTLIKINRLALKGFSFNLLTSYSDPEFMKAYLYYANPSFMLDYCKRNFSKKVALLHDYQLYEFSMIVRKE